MKKFLLKRFVTALIVMWGVSTLVFLLIHLVPGDPVQAMLGESALQTDIDNLRERLGLNEPLLIQYKNYFLDLLKGDFGTSIVSGRKVTKEILSRFPATLELAVASILIAVLISFPLGLLSALKKDSAWDVLATAVSTLGLAIPFLAGSPINHTLFHKAKYFSCFGKRDYRTFSFACNNPRNSSIRSFNSNSEDKCGRRIKRRLCASSSRERIYKTKSIIKACFSKCINSYNNDFSFADWEFTYRCNYNRDYIFLAWDRKINYKSD